MPGCAGTPSKASSASLPSHGPERSNVLHRQTRKSLGYVFRHLTSISGEDPGTKLSPGRPSADQRQEMGDCKQTQADKKERAKTKCIQRISELTENLVFVGTACSATWKIQERCQVLEPDRSMFLTLKSPVSSFFYSSMREVT